MCGGQTELQKTLVVFQFTNPGASVSFRNGGTVHIIVDERELKELETHLNKLSTPHRLLSLSVKYTKRGRTYNHNLYNMVQYINASNIGKVKKGAPITYFDNLAKDIDGYTKDLSNLAGDDSGSYGSPKTTSITLQDSEAPSASSSTVGVCGTVQPVYGKTCPTGYFYFDDMTGNPDQYPCVPDGNTCNLETGQQ
jgi:hypothetical protein